jgi:hypothetical protein
MNFNTLPLLIVLALPIAMQAQSTDDKKITIHLSDTTGIYEKVKLALVHNDFIVKDDGNRDTLTTYPREFKRMAGYSIVRAEICGTDVILSGIYGLKKVNDWGLTSTPKHYKAITYFRGSKGWRVLEQVAEEIGATFTYSK